MRYKEQFAKLRENRLAVIVFQSQYIRCPSHWYARVITGHTLAQINPCVIIKQHKTSFLNTGHTVADSVSRCSPIRQGDSIIVF